jgi:phosphoglycolate phosphatase
MNLAFDLDGTLTDPELGITRCVAQALECLGHSAPERVQLRRFIGPPLRDAFTVLLATADSRARP